ncbi:MAG TPA: extracellular solute-binding protein, partial [bacterium]|nr:extracellular solute-binding protein [bacterium]
MGKKIWFFALVVFIAGLLGGCPRSKQGITLRCIGWGDEAETRILQNAVEEFKKSHPDVNVELSRAPYGEYITKVLTEFAGGTAPDVMAVNAEQMISFASRGVFVDLKPYVAKDPALKLSDFYPEAIDHYTVNGILTALPRDIAPVAVIYYNKNEFDAAGVPYPKDSWDYKQFLETAKKLTQKEGKGRVTQ